MRPMGVQEIRWSFSIWKTCDHPMRLPSRVTLTPYLTGGCLPTMNRFTGTAILMFWNVKDSANTCKIKVELTFWHRTATENPAWRGKDGNGITQKHMPVIDCTAINIWLFTVIFHTIHHNRQCHLPASTVRLLATYYRPVWLCYTAYVDQHMLTSPIEFSWCVMWPDITSKASTWFLHLLPCSNQHFEPKIFWWPKDSEGLTIQPSNPTRCCRFGATSMVIRTYMILQPVLF